MAHSYNIHIPASCGNPQIDAIWCEINKLRQYVYSHGGGNGACCVESVNGKTGVVVLTTADIPELTNLYYTDNRVRLYGDTRWSPINHTHLLGDILDFPSQTGQANKVLITNGTTPYWGDIPSTYTDEKAQDAFAALIAAGNHSGISFVYDDALNRMNVVVNASGIGGAFQVDSFTVGATGFPQAGEATYSNDLLQGKLASELLVFVDGLKIPPSKSDRFSYTIAGKTITFNAALQGGAVVEVILLSGKAPAPTTTTTTTVAPTTTTTTTVGATTTTTTTTAPPPVYYGVRNDSTTATAFSGAEIASGVAVTQNPAGVISVNYAPLTSTLKYCWLAVPVPNNKTHWETSILNQGGMGTTDDLFGVRQTVDVGGISYYVWNTSYATQFDAVCLFS